MVVPWKCIPGLRGSNHNIQTYDSVEHGVQNWMGQHNNVPHKLHIVVH